MTTGGCVAEFPMDFDREALASICRRYGVAELSLFGSLSKGKARPDSDVDLLYVLAPAARVGWEIENLADELGVLFGKRVDLVSKRYLHRVIREEVLASARVIYAA